MPWCIKDLRLDEDLSETLDLLEEARKQSEERRVEITRSIIYFILFKGKCLEWMLRNQVKMSKSSLMLSIPQHTADNCVFKNLTFFVRFYR